jgi:hypothetical protein
MAARRSGPDVTQAEIIAALLVFIERQDTSEADFERLALQVFAYQFQQQSALSALCGAARPHAALGRSWRDIPAVPITAFKDLTLSCTPAGGGERVFMTSGTTRNVRGRSYHPTLAVWNAR